MAMGMKRKHVGVVTPIHNYVGVRNMGLKLEEKFMQKLNL